MGWIILWLWAIYNLFIVIFGLFYRRLIPAKSYAHFNDEEIAILYPTYNDFCLKSVLSLINQTHKKTKLIICDDSTELNKKKGIDTFAQQYPDKVSIVRRSNRKGFKAGNINYAISNYVNEEYIAIADADEIFPSNFIEKMLPFFSNDKIGFLQANHKANPHQSEALPKILGPIVNLYYKYFLAPRNYGGFVPFMGHGGIIRRSVWEKTGGFPEIVSEDVAFSLLVREANFFGRYVSEVICWEDFPVDYIAMLIRQKKWAAGTVELFKKHLTSFLRSKVTIAEKLDFLLSFIFLPITPFLQLNLLLNCLIFNHLAINNMSIFGISLIIVSLIAIFSPIVPAFIYLYNYPSKLFNFISLSIAIFPSLVSASAKETIGQLQLGKKAHFHVTPKIALRSLTYKLKLDLIFISLFGLTIILFSIKFFSLFTPFALGIGLGNLCAPLFIYWNENNISGKMIRLFSFMPLFLIVLSLFLWATK